MKLLTAIWNTACPWETRYAFLLKIAKEASEVGDLKLAIDAWVWAKQLARDTVKTLGYQLPLTTPCIEWLGLRNPRGYGIGFYDVWKGPRGKNHWKKIPRSAHAQEWEKHHGRIPRGKVICHKCDNPACVNIDHLFLGTNASNVRDAALKGTYRGEKNGRAQLTEEIVIEIRKAFAAGERPSKIAQRFNCNHTTISAIIHRRSWKHI